MEGRGQQLTSVDSGMTLSSPCGVSVSTKLFTIADRAKEIRNEPLKTLIHNVDKQWLEEAWRRTRKNAAAGIDKVSAVEYSTKLDENLDKLVQKIHGQYRASPTKRVYIPKSDGYKRPLGLPTIEDKIAQRAVSMILEEVYEQEFLPMSFGFRPGCNAHQAINGLRSTIIHGKVRWVLDADMKTFFDTIDHEWMIKFLSHRIGDRKILALIGKWLKAGSLEEGKLTKSSTGTPQGGVISPLLANVYLHYVLDLWVTKVVPKHLRGEIRSFRYADDVVFCFEFRNDAVRFLTALKHRLGKFGLSLNEQKTKLVRFGCSAEKDRIQRGEKRSTFKFLGFTFFNTKTQKGRYQAGCRTSSKSINHSMNRVRDFCKQHRHQNVAWQARYLNAILRGHYNYFAITGNFRCIAKFYRHVTRMWKRYLGRRSQRAYLNEDKFQRILRSHPLLQPKVYHSIYKRRRWDDWLS